VIAAARDFAAFQVDLTHSDSPEVQARVKEFKIQGVPTVVFLAPDGREVENARFSGFLPAGHFLERLRLAAGAGRES
jgi:thiol:disulfide interchange protein DsbD